MNDPRIEQFRKMTEADPENELGHFSLGQALLQHGDFAAAVRSLERALEINPQNSRAYYLLAQAQKGAGDLVGAVSTLRVGFDIAHGRGDIKARNDMAALMRELGDEPPPVEEAPPPTARPAAPATGEGTITCTRCGELTPRMARPPFKGQLGQKVFESVCPQCWREWIHMGTKVINELRLDFANPRDAEVYDMHLKEFLNIR